LWCCRGTQPDRGGGEAKANLAREGIDAMASAKSLENLAIPGLWGWAVLMTALFFCQRANAQPPVINSVTNAAGQTLTSVASNGQIVINGSGFGTQGSNYIEFGYSQASGSSGYLINSVYISMWSNGQVRLTVPEQSEIPPGSYLITVNLWDGNEAHPPQSSNAVPLSVVFPQPIVSYLSAGAQSTPGGGYQSSSGETITIYGNYFGDPNCVNCGNGSGSINLTPAPGGQPPIAFTLWKETEVAFVLPSTFPPGNYELSVTDGAGQTSASVALRVLSPNQPVPQWKLPTSLATMSVSGPCALDRDKSWPACHQWAFNLPTLGLKGGGSTNAIVLPLAATAENSPPPIFPIQDTFIATGQADDLVNFAGSGAHFVAQLEQMGKDGQWHQFYPGSSPIVSNDLGAAPSGEGSLPYTTSGEIDFEPTFLQPLTVIRVGITFYETDPNCTAVNEPAGANCFSDSSVTQPPIMAWGNADCGQNINGGIVPCGEWYYGEPDNPVGFYGVNAGSTQVWPQGKVSAIPLEAGGGVKHLTPPAPSKWPDFRSCSVPALL
jgi:hypothetical protein